jgi:hypothetical protein
MSRNLPNVLRPPTPHAHDTAPSRAERQSLNAHVIPPFPDVILLALIWPTNSSQACLTVSVGIGSASPPPPRPPLPPLPPLLPSTPQHSPYSHPLAYAATSVRRIQFFAPSPHANVYENNARILDSWPHSLLTAERSSISSHLHHISRFPLAKYITKANYRKYRIPGVYQSSRRQ